MKKLIIPIAALLMTFQFQSCKNNTKSKENTNEEVTASVDHSTSQNAIDWAGTYEGTIPCADCPGIKTIIKLYDNETFSYTAEYLEKNTTVQDTGKFMWHSNGSIVHLTGLDLNTKYKVGENRLIQLDTEGNIIEGALAKEYELNKVK